MMDKECKEKLEMEEHFLVSESVQNRVKTSRCSDFTSRCPGCLSLLKETARQAHGEKLPKAV